VKIIIIKTLKFKLILFIKMSVMSVNFLLFLWLQIFLDVWKIFNSIEKWF